MKQFLFIIGLLVLLAIEIFRVYFIMPFPGSQHNNTIHFAYWLNNNIIWIRIILWVLIAYPVIQVLRHAKVWKKALMIFFLLIYGAIFYLFNFRFLADKIFYQPVHKDFANATANKIAVNKLIIGVKINGEAKAYPIQLIGYHHQVRDTIGNTSVMVTYCTVCRTGRVFSPLVNGKNETFRLVGMDHFNAMFEDASTKSWWRQETGSVVAGPLQGVSLAELPSTQVTLAVWLKENPASLILQPDTLFKEEYDDLADYDKGTIKGGLEKRDSTSWKFKSWVIGIVHGDIAKAYDWNELVSKKMIQDSLNDLPILISLEKDTASFHVWDRNVNGAHLQFVKTADSLKDINTQSYWDQNGLCIDGQLKGTQLKTVQAYQEFWHSWNTFHPNTIRYK